MTPVKPAVGDHRDGVLISVRVTPRTSRTEITGMADDGAVTVRLAAAPVDGKANQALLRLIAGVVGVSPSRVTVVSGESTRRKTLLVKTDIGARAISARIEMAIVSTT